MTTTTLAAPASASLSGVAVLNGPEDEPAEWSAIDWQTIEQDVRRLRQRIFTCLLEPDAVKAASPVLRGAGRSNAPGLPDDMPEIERLGYTTRKALCGTSSTTSRNFILRYRSLVVIGARV